MRPNKLFCSMQSQLSSRALAALAPLKNMRQIIISRDFSALSRPAPQLNTLDDLRKLRHSFSFSFSAS